MRKTIVFTLFAALCGFSSVARVLAQGDMTGVNGANRRVVASGGYGAVTGTLTEPSSFTVGTNAQWAKHRNKPEMYMGATFDYKGQTAVESDAGVSWAQISETDSTTGDVYPAQVWWAFTRVSDLDGSGGYVPLRLSDGKQWRVKKGDLGSFTMTCAVQPDGKLKLTVQSGSVTVSGLDSVKWPTKDGKIRDDVIADMKAKRVVALTQQGGLFYDNIYVRGVGFSGGQVAPISRKDGKLALGAYVNWSSVADKEDTPIPWGRNADATGKPAGVWVVDMDSPHNRDNNGVPGDRANLYDSETVNINLLRKPTAVAGKKTKVGG